MTDLAVLGLEIKSKGVTEATKALDGFSAASKNAEGAAKKVSSGAAGFSKGAESMAKSAGLARHEMINLSRQVQDVGVSLVSGQSPFMVLAQQGTQVYDIFASSKGTLGGFGAQIASMITPTRVLGVGVVAVGAAAYFAAGSWKDFAIKLDDTSKIAGVASSNMAKLQASMSFKGIGFDESADILSKFASSSYQARNNMGGLADVLRANGIPASKEFETNLGNVADLIRRARGDTQLQFSILQQSGLPATMQMVRYMEQGAAGIRDAKNAASEFGGAANDNLVAKAREFDEMWNKATTNGTLYFKSWVSSALSAMDQLAGYTNSPKFKILLALINPMAAAAILPGMAMGAARTAIFGQNPQQRINQSFDDVGGGASNIRLQRSLEEKARKLSGQGEPNDPNVLQRYLSLEQQRLSLLGQTATIEEQLRSVEISIQQARLNGANITKADQERIVRGYRTQLEGARLLERAELGLVSAEDLNAQKQREMQALLDKGTLSMNEQAQAAVALARKYKDIADRAAIAGAAYPQLKSLEISLSDMGKMVDGFAVSGLNNLSSALTDIATGAVSAKEGFRNLGLQVLRSLTDMIIKMTIIMPIARALQGILGGIFGGGGGGVGLSLTNIGGLFANGGMFGANDNIAQFARGGAFTNQIVSSPTLFRFASGGAMNSGLMGEAGPEAIMPLTRGPDGKLGVHSQGSGSGVVNINQTMTFNNADPGSEARIRVAIAKMGDEAVKRARSDRLKSNVGYVA